jgi:hypothetical protein
MNMALVAVAFTTALAWTESANAAPVFLDDFNSTTTQKLNQTVFTNWTVTSGSVDVIGDGGSFAFLPPGNGNYVDLDGSTGAPGTITTKMIFAAGTYVVTFDLAGSQGGANNVDPIAKTTEVAFSIGGVTKSLTLNPTDPLQTYSYTFTTTAPGQLSFSDLAGGNNNVGNLLDNVSVTAVPEPATWAMMILGFFGVGFLAYRQRAGSALRIV